MVKIPKLNSRQRIAGPKTNGAPPAPPAPPALIKLDIGCGPNKKPDFKGCDSIAFPGVDFVFDLRQKWPFEDASVSEAHSSHCLEHFESMERVHFLNELYRVLVPGGKCLIVVPNWSSGRAYGDPTHKFPPVSDFAFYYWKRDWRLQNAPHCDAQHLPGGFNCNFEVTWGYSLHPEITNRNQEYQQHAITFFKEACQDTIATLTKA